MPLLQSSFTKITKSLILQEKIPNRVFECAFYAVDEKLLKFAKAILLSLGYTEHELITQVDLGKQSLLLFMSGKNESIKLSKLFDRLKIKGLSLKISLLKPSDWLTRWKKNWKPAQLTTLLDVVPVWYKNKYKKPVGRDFILMDTLLSFGTGLHETTQIVAQMIEDKREHIKTFLDIGTGTGILTMVALKHGAEDVLAFDIGDLSVKAAKENLTANKLKAKVVLADINRYPLKKTYDFVAANLVTQDLIQAKDKISSLVKPGGFLAVSGVSMPNVLLFLREFKVRGLKLVQTKKEKQWAGFLYQKTK